jgi:ATP-dependent Lon protease
MPASRWSPRNLYRNFLSDDSVESFWADFAQHMDLFMTSGNAPVEFPSPEPESGTESEAFPETLPVLPLRGLVVFPMTAVPLTIGIPRSIRLVDDVVSGDKLVALVAARNPELENPAPEDLYKIGTVGIVERMLRAPDGTIRLLVQGVQRVRLTDYTQTEPYLKARIERLPETVETGLEMDALSRNARDQFETISNLIPSFPTELAASVGMLEDPLQLFYTIANFQRFTLEEAQNLLELDSTLEKLHKLVAHLTHEAEVLQLGQKIQDEARSEIDKMQREYFLREQLKAIQRELGDRDIESAEANELRERLEKVTLSAEAQTQADRELERLSRLPSASPEYGVIRTYLDWMASLPWQAGTQDNLDIVHAREVLEQDHYGLKDIKERILEFLAVRKLRLERAAEPQTDPKPEEDQIRRDRDSVILCFVGPPGVGKTSLGQSIARALGRKFIRISLGGVRDEAEIRGHRRTYIGAMPGRILQSLRRVNSLNPVFMLDEMDKLTRDAHGDPASALLEALDPEQNREFRDNYLEVAYDLSQVMFIATANTLETIPSALRDRMEVIRLSGYTEGEKRAIAQNYLIPRQIRENGLRASEVEFTEDAIRTLILNYTREAGVRNLERAIGSICRKLATRIAEGKQDGVLRATPEMVKELLGHQTYYGSAEINNRTAIPGVATGLVWTYAGGDITYVEATRMPGSKGFQLTGLLGNVMQESARAALSYVRSRADALNIDPAFYDRSDIHLHVPAGATPKDGPSAGVTIATALISLLWGRPVRSGVGMTGEITLRGQVLPIGGVKEKVLAAHRSGLHTVILPEKNKADLEEDVPEEVQRSLKFIFVENMDDVIKAALGKKPARKKPEKPAQPAEKPEEKEVSDDDNHAG